VKIGPVDLGIIGLRAIIKKEEKEKRKKLTQAKHIALPVSLPSGLSNFHPLNGALAPILAVGMPVTSRY